MESVQGHLDQLQAKWQSFGANLADSEALKAFIDVGGGVITVLDKMTDWFGWAGVALLPLTAGLSKLGNKGIFKTFQQLDSKGNVTQGWGFFGIANAKQKAFDLNELEDYIQTQESYAKRYKEVFDAEIKKDGVDEHTAHRTAMVDIERADDALKDMIDTEKHGTDVSKKFGDAQRKSFDTGIKGAKALSASFKAMAASMAAEMAIMLALTLAIKGFQKLNEEFHITAASKVEAMENAVNDYNEALEQSGDNISTIKGLQDEFETLARGVNDAGENIGLSADEYERYHEIVDELVDINPELVQRYDKEGNAIIDRNTAIEKGIELQEEYQDKATRDYINSGDDILKGARVNINDALEDARKQAGEMGEVGDLAAQTFGQAFAATLKGEAEPGAAGDILLENISNAFNGEALLGGGPNFNDVVSDYLGREVDLAKSSISTLRQVDEEFDAIIANAKAEGYSDTALQKISDQYQSFHDSLVDIDTAYQPIKDWLTAVVNEADEVGNTIASSIPEEMSAGFTAGLEQIAYEGGTADQMKTKAEELAETLQAISRGETINGIDTEVSVKLEDGTKVVSTYQEALEDAEKAKKDFDDSNRNSDAVDDYNEAVETEVKVLNALADEWEDVDAAVAESLRSQANAINSYASDNIMTLTEALNPLADKFDEARGAKERFDAAMEASGDYDTAIDSFKEVYDEIMTSENTAGNGSIALNTGAAQILGQDRVFELGSIDKIKKELKEIKPILKGGEEGTRAFFERLRECEGALNKVSDGAVTVDKATGEISFDFDEDKWAEYARAMGVSVEVLSAAVDNARQFADIDLGNLETIKSSIMDMDGSIIKKNGKEVYQSLQNFRTAALAAGYGIEEINDRVEDLKDEGVHLIDLTEDAVTLAESLASLGSEYGLAQDSNKDGIYEIDAEKTITQMFAWGESVDSVRTKITELLEAAENGDIELNFEKPNDVSWEDWIEDLKAQFDIQFGETEDPFSKMASSADKFTDAVNNLIVALGHLPDDYEIGTNFDEIVDDINNLTTNENLSDNQKNNLTNAIAAGIDDANAEIEKYEQLLDSGNLTDAEKRELTLNIDNAKEQVEQFEEILEDLRDNGKLDNFIFDEETESFFKKANTGNEALDEELFKAEKWEQQGKISADNLQKIKDGTLESVFGNVNMDERVVIEWSDALKGKYAEELASWDYNPEIGTIDTVFGGSDAFKIDDQEVEVAYTPIMNVDGEAIFLGKETVTSYIQTIMDEASKDGQWDLSEILALDKQGLEIDGQLIQGLIAGVGDGAEEIGYLMHSAGEYGAIELAKGFESVDVSGKISNRTLNILDKALAVDREDIELAVNATVNGEQDIEGLLEDLDIAEEDRTTVINAVTSYAEGDMESYMDSLLSLPPYVQTLVTALTSGALGDISLVDGQLTLLGNKTVSPIINLLDNASRGIQNVITNMVATDGMVAKPTVNIAVTGLGLLNTAKNAINSLKEKLGIGGSHLGTPQSPNYRAHSSFPSMAKGGRLGPRGNGGLTLTGELGTELVWIPSESRSFLVGQYGPEMVDLPGDAVVYPADQTRKILGDTISPGRLRFGTGSMAKGNMQFGSMGDANGSYNPNSHSLSSSSKNKNKNTKKSSIDAYEKELARLDHLLEMGYISEKTYYEKLQKLYTQHEKTLKKNTEKNREALEKQRQARIDAYEYEKGLLDSKLDRGIIGEVKYYEKLLTLGKDYYTKDGKIRKGYADEWRKWREDLKNARNDAFDTEQEKLDSKLERDIINTEKYYKEAEKLRKKYNPEDRDEKYREAQDAVGEEWGKEIDKILQNVEDNELGIGGYNENTAIRKLKAQKTFIENMVKLYPELADEAKEAYREIAEAIKDLEDQQKEDLEEQKDQLETFIDLVEDMIRQEAEDYIDSLEDQKDAFDDLIDKRKEMLKLAEDEAAFYEDIEDGNREISKIQQEIDALSRDDSRAAQAKIAELEEEKAELVRNQNTTIRKETYDQAIDILDKQSELYGEIMDNAIKVVEDWLNNKAAVLDVVVDTIEQKETNDLLNRLVKFNGAHGDGYLSTVKDAVEDIDTLIGKYGTDIGKIVEILQKSVDDGTHVGLITPAEAGYEKPQMHHSGLAAGFTGNGATLKQNEVWRLLTDDELVLNKADQLRLGHSMGILESIKSSYANLSKSIEIPSTAVVPNVEIVIDSPITIQGNTSADIVNELDKFRHKLANDTFDKLNDALRLNGIFTGSSSNARKFN